jgi:hypothetical protein
MVLGQKRRAVGVFLNRSQAEQALSQLNRAGFRVAKISMVAKYADHDAKLDGAGMSDCAGDEAQQEAATGAIAGGMLGAVIGCLAGLGMLSVPGVGFIVAVGTAGTACAMTIAGAGIGAAGGGLILVFASLLEIPSDRARVNSDRCLGGEYLLMVDCTDDEVHRAASILSRSCSSKVWVC